MKNFAENQRHNIFAIYSVSVNLIGSKKKSRNLISSIINFIKVLLLKLGREKKKSRLGGETGKCSVSSRKIDCLKCDQNLCRS